MEKKNFLSENLKYIRVSNNKTQQQIADICNKQNTAVANWEKGIRTPDPIDLLLIANRFNLSVNDLIEKDLRNIDIQPIELEEDVASIPVFGTIKAGVPIESQTDIIDYVEIPRHWLKGDKKFFALKISGDSMYPKYQEDDIVVFEQTNDTSLYNGKDLAIMINGTESTFKKLIINENGIVLQPYNPAYDLIMFSNKQVEQLPVTVIGIAREKRTKVNTD